MGVNSLIAEAAKSDYRQKTASLKALMSQAEQARSGMHIFGGALAREIGGEFNLAANKSLKRATQKVDNKYNGDASRITDLVRGRIFVDDVESIIKCRDVLNPRKGSKSFLKKWAEICADGDGYFIQDFDDKHLDPTKFGWRDISVRVRVPLGKGQTHTGEIQILHRFMAAADALSHPIYNAQRRLLENLQKSGREMSDNEANRFAGMSAQRLKIHNEAAERAGLFDLQRVPSAKFDKVA